MSTIRRITGLLAAGTLVAGLVTGIGSSAAFASPSGEGSDGAVIAADASDVIAIDEATVAHASGPRAVASIPRGIVVTRHGGQPVTLTAAGQPTLRKPRPGNAPTTFTDLRPGVTYTVHVGSRTIGRVTALNRPAAAAGLVVRATGRADSVRLTWKHKATRATGGARITYEVVATSASGPTVRTTVSGRTSARLTGLAPDALYRFSVTPRNTVGAGKATSAAMRQTLAAITGTSGTDTPVPTAPVPTTPEVAPTPIPTAPAPTAPAPTAPAPTAPAPVAPAPAADPAPAPAPGPAPTRVIYVCPDGFTETAAGVCQKTLAYTYEILAYTYHSEPIYGYGQTGWNYTWGHCTGEGVSGNWPNGDPYCRTGTFGDGAVVGTQSVKDPTPAGYTDTGTSWQRREATPEGYLDDGTQWVMVASKVAQVVPA